MSDFFLIRHGKPDFPTEETYCLGHTDFPLGPEGHAQAKTVSETLRPYHCQVYSSRLSRSLETAACFETPVTICEGLEEMNAGLWDGYPFSKIKELWPELYEARGADKTLPLPGAEPMDDAYVRFEKALTRLLAHSEGNVAIVSHASVIGAFLAVACGKPAKNAYEYRLPYGGFFRGSFDPATGALSLSPVMHFPDGTEKEVL